DVGVVARRVVAEPPDRARRRIAAADPVVGYVAWIGVDRRRVPVPETAGGPPPADAAAAPAMPPVAAAPGRHVVRAEVAHRAGREVADVGAGRRAAVRKAAAMTVAAMPAAAVPATVSVAA